MSKPKLYKPTLFDRLGPDAGHVVHAAAYGLMVFGICIPLFGAASQKLEPPLSGIWAVGWVLMCCVTSSAIASGVALWLASMAGNTWKQLLVDGSSTPYKEQYSYQQALVMRGQLDEALESFEAVIAEKPDSVDARVRAAELYSREKRNHQRAAELFREIQRIATVAAGEDIYATNRLVDLLTGPLADPARALTELRRLVDRYPDSAGAVHARGALATLKDRLQGMPPAGGSPSPTTTGGRG